ncbi:hypothetical protein [uncultured Campylobacter sp.]|uniref:hypothetical protein n=1 Tax=uncultured Campylobacter sp. TaxID=218934 RepID=UPI0026162434|nr:hypothetical protein [uncultured Campylobacter sp.]
MNENKEKRGIYNVTFNEKESIFIEIESIERNILGFIKDAVLIYSKGYHNIKKDKGFGAKHIKLHLEESSNGYININELLNIGKSLREYINNFQEPFLDKEGNKERKVYEWQDEKGIRFRVVSGMFEREGLPKTPLSPFNDTIVTFYSDRNLKERMLFKNPKVILFYESKELNKQLENLLKQRNKNKEINTLLKEMKAKNIKTNKENEKSLKSLNQLSR